MERMNANEFPTDGGRDRRRGTAPITPGRALAQPVTTRVFEGLEIGPEVGRPEIRISFTVPIRYLRHTPHTRADSIHVQFFPLETTSAGAPAFFRRESLQIPRGFPLPVEEIRYEGVVAGQPFLDVRLSRPMHFEVRQGRGPAKPGDRLSTRSRSRAAEALRRRKGSTRVSDGRVAEMVEEGAPSDDRR